jgi:hypothetical protein
MAVKGSNTSSDPLTRYPGLAQVQDPATRQALKNLFDMHAGLQQQTNSLSTSVAGATSQLSAVPTPTKAGDAVPLSYLQHFVASEVSTKVATAVASIPGSPTGPSTPAPTQPPIGTTPPTGVPTSGSLTRGFNLGLATVYNSPLDIASWPVTGTISQVTVAGAPGQNGVFVTCNKIMPAYSSPPVTAGLWPQDPVAYPDAVSLEYTVWIVLQTSPGVWSTAGFIQMWVGRPGTGATPMNTDWTNNWAYSSVWGPLHGATPTFGTQMGFFLSAGNARGTGSVTTIRERSEVVLLNLPADINGGTYS